MDLQWYKNLLHLLCISIKKISEIAWNAACITVNLFVNKKNRFYSSSHINKCNTTSPIMKRIYFVVSILSPDGLVTFGHLHAKLWASLGPLYPPVKIALLHSCKTMVFFWHDFIVEYSAVSFPLPTTPRYCQYYIIIYHGLAFASAGNRLIEL